MDAVTIQELQELELLPRLAWAIEGIEITGLAEVNSGVDEALYALRQLEQDVEKLLGADKRPHVCGCGRAFRWPGELEAHTFMCAKARELLDGASC